MAGATRLVRLVAAGHGTAGVSPVASGAMAIAHPVHVVIAIAVVRSHAAGGCGRVPVILGFGELLQEMRWIGVRGLE